MLDETEHDEHSYHTIGYVKKRCGYTQIEQHQSDFSPPWNRSVVKPFTFCCLLLFGFLHIFSSVQNEAQKTKLAVDSHAIFICMASVRASNFHKWVGA